MNNAVYFAVGLAVIVAGVSHATIVTLLARIMEALS